MPQAADEFRDLISRWFANYGDFAWNQGPTEFLGSRGYELIMEGGPDRWCWRPPTPAHTPRFEELACINFMVDEWDYGGLRNSLWQDWEQGKSSWGLPDSVLR